MKTALFLFACFFAVATAVGAQTPAPLPDDEADFIVPARPTASNPAEFQRPGVLQLELGYNGNFRARDNFESQFDLPLAIRFAVSRRTLIEADLDSPYSFRDPAGVVTRGTGDMQLGIQQVFEHETADRPGVALAYYIKLPTARNGLGTGRVDHNFIALLSKTEGKTTVDLNVIYLLAGRTTSNGHASSGQAAIAVTQALNEKFGLQGEISGASRSDQQAASIFGLGVVTYQLNRRVVFDSGLRTGLTAGTPRVGVVAGVTVGIANLYKKHH